MEHTSKIFMTVIISHELRDMSLTQIISTLDNSDIVLEYSYQVLQYWQSPLLSQILFIIDIAKPLATSEWVALFDRHINSDSVFRDDSFLEILHSSSIETPNEPFIILNIHESLLLD